MELLVKTPNCLPVKLKIASGKFCADENFRKGTDPKLCRVVQEPNNSKFEVFANLYDINSRFYRGIATLWNTPVFRSVRPNSNSKELENPSGNRKIVVSDAQRCVKASARLATEPSLPDYAEKKIVSSRFDGVKVDRSAFRQPGPRRAAVSTRIAPEAEPRPGAQTSEKCRDYEIAPTLDRDKMPEAQLNSWLF